MRIEANGTQAQASRAWKIYQRYRNNIQSKKSWDNDYKKALAIENENIDGARSIVRNANNRQYSQNTYMGINAG